MLEIKSDVNLLINYTADLKKTTKPPSLKGVDDDNTLAESGIYNTYNTLRDAYGQALSFLKADAENVEKAGKLLEETDAANAKNIEGK